MEAIEDGSVFDLPVRLGIQGKILSGTGAVYPLVLELPTKDNSFFGDVLTDAATQASCEPLMKKLNKGWSEGVATELASYWLGVKCASDAQFISLIEALPSRTATRGNKVLGNLAFGKSKDVRPLLSGSQGKLTSVTPSELLGLGVIIDIMSDTSDNRASGYDIRAQAPLTNTVRDQFNRSTGISEMSRSLAELGWLEVSADGPATQYRRDGEQAELIRDICVFVTSPGTTARTTLRAFDLITLDPEHAGNPDAAASWLVTEGHVPPVIESLVAGGKRREIEMNQDSGLIVKAFSEAVRDARSASDSTLPLAFSMQATSGVHQAIVSYMPSGTVRVWNEANAGTLLLAAAQPVYQTETKKGTKTTYSARIDSNIVRAVLANLENPGVLPPVEHVSTGPILTSTGRIASIPGYDRKARALVVIPHRERAKWAAYSVPENPTRAEAQAAYEFLNLELMNDLPYATDGDRARHMLYILTAVGRSITTGSVGFLATASDAGTGKSLSLLIGRLIAQGHPGCTDFKATAEADTENEKRLGALISEKNRFFHADEVVRGTGVDGEVITKLTTATDGEFAVRKLGVSTTLPASGVVVTACGNRVHLKGDTSRRFLPIRYAYSGVGSVLSRTGFRHPSLLEYVVGARPLLVAAVHTILLHGIQAGPSRIIPGLGFSHDWAARIVGAASHLTTEDGREVGLLALEGWLESVDASSTLSDDWAEFLVYAWRQLKGKSAEASVLRTLTTTGNADSLPILPPALSSLRFESDRAANREWGRTLGTILGSSIPVEGGYFRIDTVTQSEKSNRVARWQITGWDKAGNELDPRTSQIGVGEGTPALSPQWQTLLATLFARRGATLMLTSALRATITDESNGAPIELPEELRGPFAHPNDEPKAWRAALLATAATAVAAGQRHNLLLVEQQGQAPMWVVTALSESLAA
ncbi:hypothetical protein A20C1_03263 [marine actinobacterium PHSC20C1]|nr:hypothetical protein A20C1_03263 [marine actinobacterium PHSC20C1]